MFPPMTNLKLLYCLTKRNLVRQLPEEKKCTNLITIIRHLLKDVKEQDLKNFRNKLQAADTCHYLQDLLESQEYQPYEYNELLDKLPSKMAFNYANLHASQLYNAELESQY